MTAADAVGQAAGRHDPSRPHSHTSQQHPGSEEWCPREQQYPSPLRRLEEREERLEYLGLRAEAMPGMSHPLTETGEDLPPSYIPYTPRQNFNWSFTQGLLIGQLSVLIVLSAFVKFFIFGDAPDQTKSRQSRRYSSTLKPPGSGGGGGNKHQAALRKKRSAVLRNPPPLTTASILTKTYYNVNSHQPESLDWFNVLIAQTIAQFREEARTDDALLGSLDKLLNGPLKPAMLDRIKVTEVSLGEEFPIFSNCRISPLADEPGKLRATMDVDLSDMLTLGIETKLLLNYPKPMTATLPVALAVSIVRFSGTLSISFVPSHENDSRSTTLSFSFADDYHLDINVRSLVGSRSRLQDVPKIAQLVESRMYQWIDERCVEPKFQQIVLPSLWPRKKTTREREDGGASTAASASASATAGAGTGVGQGQGTGVEREATSPSGSMRRRQAPSGV